MSEFVYRRERNLWDEDDSDAPQGIDLTVPSAGEEGATSDVSSQLEHVRQELQYAREELLIARTKEEIAEDVSYRAAGDYLPPPSVLQRYMEIDSHFSERLMHMAELEQEHRHSIERSEVREPFLLAKRGQLLAISAVVLVLAFCGILAFLGNPEVGAIVASLDLVGLVVVFVTGQRAGAAIDVADEKAHESDGAGAKKRELDASVQIDLPDGNRL